MPLRKDEDKTEHPPEPDPSPTSGTEKGLWYLNATSAPVTYDEQGHQVGGGEWIGPIRLDSIGERARDHGHLHVSPPRDSPRQ